MRQLRITEQLKQYLKVDTLVVVLLVSITSMMVILPIVAIIARPFLAGGFTALDFFQSLVTRQVYINMWTNTFIVVLGSTALAAAIGVPFAVLTNRVNFPWRKTMEQFFIVPFFISPLLSTGAWILLFGGKAGIVNYALGLGDSVDIHNVGGMVLLIGIFLSSYIFLFTSSGVQYQDPELEEASSMLGASKLRTLLRITIPLAAPSILSGVLLCFVISLGFFSAPALLGAPKGIYTASVMIYDLFHSYPRKYDYALVISLILLTFSGIALTIRSRVLGRRTYVTIGRKGVLRSLYDVGKWKWLIFFAALSYLTIGVFLPLSTLIYASFLPYWNPGSMPSLTLQNYSLIFSYALGARSIWNSLLLALATATIGTFLFAIVSYAIIRAKSRYARFVETIYLLPSAMPAISMAVGLLVTWLYVPLPVYGTIWILLIAYLTLFSPHAVRTLTASVTQIDPSLEEGSRMCGAGTLHTIRKVVLPLIKPGLLSTWIIIFIGALRDLEASIVLVSYGNEVMSVATFELWNEVGSKCAASAMATIQIALIFGVLMIFRKIWKVDVTKIM